MQLRIFFTGVGGQGTLTATNLLANTALLQGLDVTAGEIHGMAQRGGVVESMVLLGGLRSPKIGHGEADILLGFEPLETLRALPYLKSQGAIFSNTEALPPVSVCLGKACYPLFETIEEKAKTCAGKTWFLPLRTLGQQAGAVQSGNLAMLGALCASGLLPFGPDALMDGIRAFMRPALVDVNLKAVELGVAAVA